MNWQIIKVNNMENTVACLLSKDVFEKSGKRRLISCGEYFAYSDEVTEYDFKRTMKENSFIIQTVKSSAAMSGTIN